MQLTLWTYEGPPHIGAMRVATAMQGLHYVLHAPQGDTYADLLFTMIERRGARPPVTYSTFQACDLGGDTAELFKTSARDAYERFAPQAMIVGASCTAELIQDDPGGLAKALNLPIPVIGLELPAYQKKENWGAAETFYRLARNLAGQRRDRIAGAKPSCNILGPTALGFRHRDDVREITGLLRRLGVEVRLVAPLGATPRDLTKLGEADFNVVLYPEIALPAAQWLEKNHGQAFTKITPLGVAATREFIAEAACLAGVDPAPVLNDENSRLPWYSRSVEFDLSFGQAGFHFRRRHPCHRGGPDRSKRTRLQGRRSGNLCSRVRPRSARGGEALRSRGADHRRLSRSRGAKSRKLQPELVLGTQMERHIAKRLGIPCAVISAPVHVQDFPARYSPQMGFEGANVIFDAWVHPLMMGLEEHLLAMFRDDAEFHDDAAPSHLGKNTDVKSRSDADAPPSAQAPDRVEEQSPSSGSPIIVSWADEAEKELRKIPFFVRGKARRNTERFASEQGVTTITVETLYDAKAHFAR